MARYSSFLGRRVQVQYRASDTLVPASGVFVADSGRSIFLEQSFEQRGQHRYFRWEIPYQYLIKIALAKAAEAAPAAETAEVETPAETAATEPPPQSNGASDNRASHAAAGASLGSLMPITKRSYSI
jgi:hypothetical protein